MFIVTRVEKRERSNGQDQKRLSVGKLHVVCSLLRGGVVPINVPLVFAQHVEWLRVIHVLNLSSLVVSASVARTIRRSF